ISSVPGLVELERNGIADRNIFWQTCGRNAEAHCHCTPLQRRDWTVREHYFVLADFLDLALPAMRPAAADFGRRRRSLAHPARCAFQTCLRIDQELARHN